MFKKNEARLLRQTQAVIIVFTMSLLFGCHRSSSKEKDTETTTAITTDAQSSDSDSNSDTDTNTGDKSGVYASIYTQEFTGMMMMLVNDNNFDTVCSETFSQSFDNAEGVQYLYISLNKQTSGVYPIRIDASLNLYGSILESTDEPAALVFLGLQHNEASYQLGEERFYALGGTVQVEKAGINSTTGLEDFNVSVTAQFATNRIRTFECDSLYDDLSNLVEASCKCVDDEQNIFDCSAISDEESCCLDLSAEIETIEYHFKASACSNYCTQAFTTTSDYCAEEMSADTDSSSDSDEEYPSRADPAYDNCFTFFSNTWTSTAGDLWLTGYTSTNGNAECSHQNEGILQNFDGENWHRPEFFDPIENAFLNVSCETAIGSILTMTPLETSNVSINGIVADDLQIPSEHLSNDATAFDALCENDGTIYLVGRPGLILKYQNDAWTTMNSGTSALLTEIAKGTDRIVVLGTENTVLELVSDSWLQLNVDSTLSIQNIWVSSRDEIYAVSNSIIGSSSTKILKYEAGSWTILKEHETDSFTGISGDNFGNIYVVGEASISANASHPVVWRMTNNDWTRMELNNQTISLQDVQCVAENMCYGYGQNNTFINLNDL